MCSPDEVLGHSHAPWDAHYAELGQEYHGSYSNPVALNRKLGGAVYNTSRVFGNHHH